jgi:hypothetical protein
MKVKQMGAYAGILFSIVTIPLFIGAVDAGGDDSASDATYIANLVKDHSSIQMYAGIGLLTVILLLAHIEWLSAIISKHSEFWAKISKSCGQIAAIGFVLSYGLAFAAAEKAGTWPDQVVRTVGMLAPSIIFPFLIGLTAFAGSIAILGWKGKFPKWMAFLATLILLGTIIPTAAGVPGWLFHINFWLLINSIGMVFYSRKNT